MKLDQFTKHYGPGDHKSGSSQDVHGGDGGGGASEPVDYGEPRSDTWRNLEHNAETHRAKLTAGLKVSESPTRKVYTDKDNGAVWVQDPETQRLYVGEQNPLYPKFTAQMKRGNPNRNANIKGLDIPAGTPVLTRHRDKTEFNPIVDYDPATETAYVETKKGWAAVKSTDIAWEDNPESWAEKSDQESNMKKAFPPAEKQEQTPAEAAAAAAAEAAKAAAQAAKAPADAAAEAQPGKSAESPAEKKPNPFGGDKPADGKAPEGKEAPQEQPAGETPPAKTGALDIIAAALKDGTMAESVAAQLKAAIGLEEQSEAANPDPSGIGNPEAGMSGTPAGPDPMEMRQLVLSLLEELGLVERTEAGAIKLEPAGMLHKDDAAADLLKHDDLLQKRIDDGHRALASDIAVVTMSIEALEKRLSAMAGVGPVIREIGTNFSPGNLQRADQLRKAIQNATSEADRQALQNELTTLEIKSVQTIS